jgi:hypothetical protein
MLRQTVTALALGALCCCGCSSNGHFALGDKSSGEEAQLAAFAATAKYPSDLRPSNDINAAALVNPKNDAIKIVNTSDQPMRDVNVWVNGTFVHKVNVIPPHGAASMDRSDFFDASGQNMTKLNAGVSRVELQSGDHLYSLGLSRTD